MKISFIHKNCIFVLLLLLLNLAVTQSAVTNTTNATKPKAPSIGSFVPKDGNSTAIEDDQDEKESGAKCFMDSVSDAVTRLESNIKKIKVECNMEKHKELIPLIEIAEIAGALNFIKDNSTELIKISKTVEEMITEIGIGYPIMRELKMLVSMRQKQLPNNQINVLSQKIYGMFLHEVQKLKKTNDYATFFLHRIKLYLRNQYQLNYFKNHYKKDSTVCVTISKDLQIPIKEFMANENVEDFNPDGNCKNTNEDEISPMNVEEGGWTVTFWTEHDVKKIGTKKITVFQGFLKNKEVMSIVLSVKNQRVLTTVKLGEKNIKEILSDSNCSDYAWNMITIKKTCDAYKAKVALRYLKSNSRKEFFVELHSNQVENMKINVIEKNTLKPNVYTGFAHSLAKEKIIFALNTSIEILSKLKSALSKCGEKPIIGCDYTIPDKTCLVCEKPKLKHEKICVDVCPKGTVMDQKTRSKCEPCHKKCIKCYGPTSDTCDECAKGYVLDGNTCKTKCPAGKVLQTGKDKIKRCIDCSTSCEKCDSPTQCTKCLSGTYLHNGKCVKNCPDETFADVKPNICKPCPDTCTSCKTQDQCTYCKKDYFLKDGKCVKPCPHSTFADKNSGRCQNCIKHCKKCSDYTTCDDCKDGFYLHDKECTTKCPEFTVSTEDGVCKKCNNPSCKVCSPKDVRSCKECDSKTVLYKGDCVKECPKNYYVDQNRKCKEKPFPNCAVWTPKKCNKCDEGYNLLNDVQCTKTCPDGYVSKDGVCHRCTGAPICLKCDKDNLDKCTNCLEGNFEYKGECVKRCPSGTRKNKATKKCEDCIQGCRYCHDNSSCIKCDIKKKWYLKGKICVKDCGVGYTLKNYKCKPCSVDDCQKCEDQNVCNECKAPKVLYNNICKAKCPIGTYLSYDKKKCNDCKEGCQDCDKPDECKKCKLPLVLENKKCKNVCSTGSVAVNGECVKCQIKNCDKCDKETQKICFTCPPESKLLLHNGKCIEKCPEGYYAKKDGRCGKCQSPCKTCTGTASDCLTCIAGFHMLKSKDPKGEDKCVDDCPKKTVLHPKKKECIDCAQKTCDKCSEIGTCIQCEKKMHLLNGKCVDKCPKEGYYVSPKDATRTCKKCLENCKKCNNSGSCKECIQGKFLDNNDKECVDDCGTGRVVVEGRCQDCKNKCEKCKTINLNICTKCGPKMYLHNGNCVNSCPDKFWANKKSMTCDNCSVRDCKICVSQGKICNKCTGKLLLEENKCKEDPCSPGYCKSEDKCIKTKIQNVKVCEDDQVIECKTGFYKLGTKQCVSPCPKGTFADEKTKSCKKCSEDCDVCDNEDKCTKCGPNFFLENDKCVRKCKEGSAGVNGSCRKCSTKGCKVCPGAKTCNTCKNPLVLLDNKCIEKCPAKYFKEGKECKKCGLFCQKCVNEDECTDCQNGKVLNHKKKCTDNCATSYVSVDGKCKKCIFDKDAPCAKCPSDKLDECSSCIGGVVSFITKQCVPNCEKGYFAEAGKCKPCQSKCQKCRSASICDACNKGYAMHEGKCKNPCPDFTERENDVCKNCPTNCKKCNKGTCTECSNPDWVLQDGVCKVQCDVNHFANIKKVCKDCQKKCKTCLNEDVCQVCIEGHFLHKKECVDTCPENTFKTTVVEDGKKRIVCKDCEKGCKACYSESECQVCNAPLAIYKGDCIEYCPAGTRKKKNAATGSYSCKTCLKNCQTCEDDKTCKMCKAKYNLILPKKDKCVPKCPDGTKSQKRKCVNCKDKGCRDCSDNIKRCKDCRDPLLLNEDICVEKCDKDQFKDQDKCKDCPVECAECANSKICTKCKPGFILQNHKCVSKCSKGYARVPANKKKGTPAHCGKCTDPKCVLCDPEDLDRCIECIPGLFICPLTGKPHKSMMDGPHSFIQLEGNSTISNNTISNNTSDHRRDIKTIKGHPANPKTKVICNGCPPPWEKDIAHFIHEKYCPPCKKECSKCSSMDTCDACKNPLLLEDKQCVKRCSKGNVAKDGKCVPCKDKNCEICDKETQEDCQKCDPLFSKKDGDCKKVCGDRYYKVTMSDKSGECKECSKNCLKCKNGITCEVCDTGFFKEDDKCVKKCKEGSVPDENNVCQKCLQQPNCKKCHASQLDKCTVCKNYNQDGICRDLCSFGYIANKHGICVKCQDKNCNICKPIDKCVECKIPFKNSNNECVEKCPSGQRADDNNFCVDCKDKNCDLCSKKLSPCIKCNKPFLMLDGKCIGKCPSGHFPTQDTKKNKICRKCIAPCATCINEKTCTSCVKDFNLTDKQTCVKDCGSGKVAKDQKCHKCEDDGCDICDKTKTDICFKCITPLLVYKGDCVKECPKKTFIDKNEAGKPIKCKDCDKQCATCSKSGKCESCIEGVLQDGECKKECSLGYSPYNKVCKKCTTPFCDICPKDTDTCETCTDTSYLYKGKCLEDCPVGTFLNKEKTACISCRKNHKYCEKCINEKICQKCKAPMVLHQSECIKKCPSNYIKINNKCVKCKHASCEKCLPNSDKCTTCPNNKYMHKGVCIDKCPSIGYFAVETPVKECKKCDPKCISCTSIDKCNKCLPEYALYKEKCVNRCPEGSVEKTDNKCHTCDDKNCKNCASDDTSICTICRAPMALYKGRCVPECPPRRFKQIDAKTGNIVCKRCTKTCQVCKDAKSCEKCVHGFYFNEDKNCDRCKNDVIVEHKDKDSTCEKCKVPNCKVCKEGNTKECKFCNPLTILHKKECLTECPEAHILVDGKCIPCSKNCARCTEKMCTKCKNDTFLNKVTGECVKPCPQRSVGITDANGLKVCKKCAQQQCLLCDTKFTATCKECDATTLMENGTCVKECSDGYFVKGRTCTPCPKVCKRCTAKSCLDCKSPKFLKNQSCVDKCGEKFWENKDVVNNSWKCVPCDDPNCLSCDPNTKCNKCSPTTYLLNGKCVDECPKNMSMFANSKTRSCESCTKDCKACNEKEGCYECKAPHQLLNLKDKKPECVLPCPKGMTPDNGKCVECTDSNCTSCEAGARKCDKCKKPFVVHLKKCVKLPCPTGFFEKDGKCEKCSSTCKTCEIKATKCTDCNVGFSLNKSTNICKGDCPAGTREPDCKPCSERNKCKICKPNLTECIKCQKPYGLYKDKCHKYCPDGTYRIKSKKSGDICIKCKIGCRKCVNGKECTACHHNFFLNEETKKCERVCKDGFFPNCKDNQCDKCRSECKTCTDKEGECDCKKFKHHKKCYDKCPKGYFGDEKTKSCKACDQTTPYCLICDADKCIRCARGFNYDKNTKKCIESKHPILVMEGPEYYSEHTRNVHRATEVFKDQSILGSLVGKNSIGFTFWIRKIKTDVNKKTEMTILETASDHAPSITSIKFILKNDNHKCNLVVESTKGIRTYLPLGDCDYRGLDKWRFYAINVIKDMKHNRATISISYKYKNSFKTETDSIPLKSELFTKYSRIELNNLDYNDAFELYNLNAINYQMNKQDLISLSKLNPPTCDFGCTNCSEKTNTCTACSGAKPNKDGSCPPAFVPIRSGANSFYRGIIYNLSKDIASYKKHVSTQKWSFTTSFYIDDDTKYVDLFSFHFNKKKVKYAETNLMTKLTIVNGFLNVNNLKTQIKIQKGIWYSFAYRITKDKEEIFCKQFGIQYEAIHIERSNKGKKPKLRVFDDLMILIGLKFTDNEKERLFFRGSVYNPRLYLNHVEHPMPHDQSQKKCVLLDANLACKKCLKGFELKDSKCVNKDYSIEKPFMLFSRISFWNDHSVTPVYSPKDTFTITFWKRQKTHADFNRSDKTGYKVFSFLNSSTGQLQNIIAERNIANFKSEYMVFGNQKARYLADYGNVLYKYDMYAITWDNSKGQKEVTVYVFQGATMKLYTYKEKFNTKFTFDKFKLGEDKGKQMNFEIAKLSVYKRVLSKKELITVQSYDTPKDCHTDCHDCNEGSGICIQCSKKYLKGTEELKLGTGTNTLICPTRVMGYQYAQNFYLDANIPTDLTYRGLNKVPVNNSKTIKLYPFSRAVNSYEYSLSAVYRPKNLQLMFNKPMNYILAALTNNADRSEFTPSENLITLGLNTTGGKAVYNFQISQLDKVSTVSIKGLKVNQNNWIYIHAGIDVKNKIFQYRVYDLKNPKKVFEKKLSLKYYPEKAQEITGLAAYGYRELTGNTKKSKSLLGIGQFLYALFTVNYGYKPALADLILDKQLLKIGKLVGRKVLEDNIPEPPCPDNCGVCTGLYFAKKDRNRNVCKKCKSTYSMSSGNGECTRPEEEYKNSFLLLESKTVRQYKSTYPIYNAKYLNSESNNIKLRFRRNYRPTKYYRKNPRYFLTYGGIRIGMRSDSEDDYLVVHIIGTEKIFESDSFNMIEGEGYNTLNFIISKKSIKIKLQIMDEYQDLNDTEAEFDFGDFSWNHDKYIHLHTLWREYEFHGLYLTDAKDFDSADLLKAPTKTCPIECSNCDSTGQCLTCFNGSIDKTADGYKSNICGKRHVHMVPVSAPNEVRNIGFSEYVKGPVLRTKRFTVRFTFQITDTKVSESDRIHVATINNLPNLNIDRKGALQNFLKIEYRYKPTSFFIMYKNKDDEEIVEKEIKFDRSPDSINSQFYVNIAYDAHLVDSSITKLGISIWSTRYVREYRNLKLDKWEDEGLSQCYLTNNAFFHLGDEKSKINYNHVRFYYDTYNNDKKKNYRKAAKYLKSIQSSCENGTSFECRKCKRGVLKSGVCVPKAFTDIHLFGKRRFLQLNYKNFDKVDSEFRSAVSTRELNKFNIGFYYKRSNYENNGSGILQIRGVLKRDIKKVGNILTAYVNLEGHLIVTGHIGNENIAIMRDFYDNKKQRFNWIYVNINYDISTNQIDIINNFQDSERDNRSFTQKRATNAKSQFVDMSKYHLVYNFGYHDKKINTRNTIDDFELSNVAFTPNYVLKSDEIEDYQPIKPRRCTKPCNSDCSANLICTNINQVQDIIQVSYKPDTKKQDEKKVSISRSLHEVNSRLDPHSRYGYWILSTQINVNKVINSPHKSNRNVILLVTNQSEILRLKYDDDISDNLINYSIITVENIDGQIVVHSGGNKYSRIKNKKVVMPLNRSMFNFDTVYLSFLFNHDANKLTGLVIADDVILKYDIPTSNFPATELTNDSRFYNHPDVDDVHLNLYNPSIMNDYYAHFTKKETFFKSRISNLCDQGKEQSCSRCISTMAGDESDQISQLDCQACLPGFGFKDNRCIKSFFDPKK